MVRLIKQNLLYIIYICLALAVTLVIFFNSYHRNLDQLESSGQIRIEQISERLLGRIESFQQLPNLLANQQEIKTLITGQTSKEIVNDILLRSALLTGATEIFILDEGGTLIAQSNINSANINSANINSASTSTTISSEEANFSNEPYVSAAMNGRLGFYHSLDSNDGSRSFYFARGVTTIGAKPVGTVVVKVGVDRLEFGWSFDEEAVTFFDNHNVIFVTNRPSLTLQIDDLNFSENSNYNFPEYDYKLLKRFAAYTRSNIFGHEILNFDKTSSLPSQALVLSKYIPQIDLTAKGYFDTRAAFANARLQAFLSAAIFSGFGIAFWALWQRRQRLTDRLVAEEAANLKLEARVDERTIQLKKAQDQLVQASKLTALGQLSAGIAHELNQPLSAIQNFADTGKKLLKRDRSSEAIKNLEHITQQTARMNRIIKNLRAFARKEVEKFETVNLQMIIYSSLALTEMRCKNNGVKIKKNGLQKQLLVSAGKVRLEQVLVNIISNAIDAMSEQDDKIIQIELSERNRSAEIKVSDNGPGIADPKRAFEPFYSTKDIGSSKGLGLGLAISHGIIGSFGGDLTCENWVSGQNSGGAIFIISLPLLSDSSAT